MLAVIAHDAGGAEILSSYVRQTGVRALYCVAGPARPIFERKLGSIAILSVDDAVRGSTSVLCGTSWQSELELDALARARQAGKPTVAFLDHWVNYADRFVRGGETQLPDEIWVGDAIAEKMAKAQFGPLPVRVVDNPYFKDVLAQLASCQSERAAGADGIAVLYVCEPVSAHALRQYGDERHFGYLETEALRFFLTNIGALRQPVRRICIRPHPAEASDKYAWAGQEFDLPVERGGARSLVQEIADCDIVVGCESMAMVIGLLAGKRVVSSIPPGGRQCRLPQPQIEHFRDIVSSSRVRT